MQAVQDPAILDECGLSDNVKKVLLENIKLKLTQQAVKIRADIEVSCFTYEGIDAIKDALRAGIACSTDEVPIKINLIAPPLYVMTTSTPEKVVRILCNMYICPMEQFYTDILSIIHPVIIIICFF